MFFSANKNFYPTPISLIEKMLSGLDLKFVHTVLEPSAGKGDLVKALEEKNKMGHTLDIDCIELDEDLRSVLKGRGYRVVSDDFLTYSTYKEYDLILMNPPFEHGDLHLLKALELQARNGGAVIALLNAESLKNLCTNTRTVLSQRLEEYGADISYFSDEFLSAERKTAVEVALIKVKLPQVKQKSFILDKLEKAAVCEDTRMESEYALCENDFIKSVIAQYNMEVSAGVSLIKEYYAMAPKILRQFRKNEDTGEVEQSGSCILSLTVGESYGYSRKDPASVNEYIREVRGKYWEALFNNPKFVGRLTENLRSEYTKRIEKLKDYEFNLNNILDIRIDMQKNLVGGIEDTIIALFEELSHKYSWYDETSKNIHYFNGWKTNQSWIINKKVIIPLRAYGSYTFNKDDYRPNDYDVKKKLQDIEKCLNYLDGGKAQSVSMDDMLERARKLGITKNIHLKHFDVTFFKKGTCHITFRDEELLKKFNIFGAQHKGWLPPSYAKKKYKDMTPEEKEVIDSFEGELSYNRVFANPQNYLFDASNIMMIEDKSA